MGIMCPHTIQNWQSTDIAHQRNVTIHTQPAEGNQYHNSNLEASSGDPSLEWLGYFHGQT
jgi:hypothetical protein